MRYYKVVSDGYILLVGEGDNGEEINKREYDEIMQVVQNAPTPSEGFCVRLREDLTWDFVPVDPPDPDPELDDEELINVLLGEGFEL